MNYKKISTGISWVLHPFLLPDLYDGPAADDDDLRPLLPEREVLSAVGGGALCRSSSLLLSLGVLRSLGRISDYRVDDRRERMLPLLIGALCYILCAVTVAKIPSAVFLRKFMLAAACCELLCLGVSFYWKISLHLTGMGAVVALLVVMNVVGVGNMMVPLVAAVLCAGALASARLYLGCHNGRQVLAGFCGGFAVSVLAVLFL